MCSLFIQGILLVHTESTHGATLVSRALFRNNALGTHKVTTFLQMEQNQAHTCLKLPGEVKV